MDSKEIWSSHLLSRQLDYAFSYNDGLTGFTWKGEAGCKLGAGNFDGCINLEFIDLHTLDNPSIENPKLNRKGFDILFGDCQPTPWCTCLKAKLLHLLRART